MVYHRFALVIFVTTRKYSNTFGIALTVPKISHGTNYHNVG